MQISSIAEVIGGEAVCRHDAAWRWLMPVLFGVTCTLQSCANPPAPNPTLNSNPQHTLKLKITLEDDSEVNRIEAQSGWVVSKLSCAPLVYPEGYRKVEQKNIPEKVEKLDDYYVAAIIMDRFLPDDCQWVIAGVGIRLFHDDHLLATTGIGADVLSGNGIFEGTCSPSPDKIHPPICFSRKQESFLREHFKGVFNITVGLMP